MNDTSTLVTEDRLLRDLVRLGVCPGSSVIVHSSMKAIGWVLGGAPTVVRALSSVLGSNGTLAMSAATPECADPATWPRPLPSSWLEEAREHLPVFDRATTPTSMGAIPETFRRWPGTRRSEHPLESICARGPSAERIVAGHPLAFSESHDGPFGRLHDLDADVLLLGVGFDRCTALHYAESRSARRRVMTVRFPLIEDGHRRWVEVPNVADDNGRHFPVAGERYLAVGRGQTGFVGDAASIRCSIRDLVEFAVDYFDEELESTSN